MMHLGGAHHSQGSHPIREKQRSAYEVSGHHAGILDESLDGLAAVQINFDVLIIR